MKSFKSLLSLLLLVSYVLTAVCSQPVKALEQPVIPGLPGNMELPVVPGGSKLPGPPDLVVITNAPPQLIPMTKMPILTIQPATPTPLPLQPITKLPIKTLKPVATPTLIPLQPITKLPIQTLQPVDTPTLIPLFPVTKLPIQTIKPVDTPTLIPLFPVTKLPIQTIQPDITPTPELNLPIPLPDPKPTAKPSSGGSGHILTSEGPPFLVFRADLTSEPWMFTPMDLSIDGEFLYPLIGDANQVVGNVKVLVRSGVAVVTLEPVSGVKIDTGKAFYTFFPDIRGITTVLPEQLQTAKMAFGMPYPVAAWLASDQKVLLYVNCPATYNTGLEELKPFSFQDMEYLIRLAALLPIMD